MCGGNGNMDLFSLDFYVCHVFGQCLRTQSCTCPECTVEQRESRIQLLPELPRQYHTGHCSDNQKDPVYKDKQKQKI